MLIAPFNRAAEAPAHRAGSQPFVESPAGPLDAYTPETPLDPSLVGLLPSTYQDVDLEPVRLPDSPPPRLDRPVVFVHGYNGSAGRWDRVIEWLTSGEEPVNRSGGIVDAGQFENLDPQANLFSLRFSRPYNAVDTNARELKAAVEAICRATGAPEVDIVCHSMGGLDTRLYLTDPGEKVRRVAMLGTPNHGSALANLERVFREKLGFPIQPPVDDPEVRRALEQLSVDKVGRDGVPDNPFLHGLNQDWPNQRRRAEFLIITGNGFPTATGGPGLTIKGDAVVTRRSSVLDGVDARHVWWKSHGGLQHSAAVLEATAAFLTGQELPAETELFDTEEGRREAEEMGYLLAS